MPIYAYKCESCAYAKDVLQKMSDPLLTQCPSCGAATFKKQLTAAGFQLKGSGWYVTDFKDGAGATKTAPAGEGAKSAGSPDAKSDGKSDSAAVSQSAAASPSGASSETKSAAPASTAASPVPAKASPPPATGS
jgi:putative FmdB family regulatory protein